jgi:hypothetical protein
VEIQARLEQRVLTESTTTTPVEGAQAEGAPPSKEAVVVVFSSLEGGFQEKSRRIDELIESLASGFTLNGRQFKLNRHLIVDVRAYAENNGPRYVEEKLELTPAEAKKNPVKFLIDALAKDWQPPVRLAKKAKPRPTRQNRRSTPKNRHQSP